MKRPTILRLWLIISAVLVLGACKKEASQSNQETTADLTPHATGVVPDDPIKVAKVPTIISEQYLASGGRYATISANATRGGKPKPGGDITAPSVKISSPSNGATVSGTTNVSVTASDNVGVISVTLSLDGNVLTTLSASPYNFSWDVASTTDGTHTLMAKATDAAGNSATSTITVAKNATITTLPPTNLPSSYFITTPPVQNQGGEGSCAAFATTYAARSIDWYYKSKASSYSYSTNVFSPEFLYDQTHIGDCSGGTGVTTALDFLVSTGVCSWQSMPYSYSNGCSLVPTASQTSEAANYKIASYSKIAVTDITAIKTMVVSNHAAIITVGTDQSFWAAGPGFIWKTFSDPPGISHSIVIVGYDDAKHAYKVMNSWGTTWGDAGFSWIDYDFLPQTAFYYCYVIN